MKARAVRVFFFVSAVFLLASCAVKEPDSGYAIYDTTKEAAAQGISLQIIYPSHWKMERDEAYPSVVQTFRLEANGLVQYLMLQVMPMEKDADILFGDGGTLDSAPRKAVWNYLLNRYLLSRAGRVQTNIRVAVHAGRPAIFVDMMTADRNSATYIQNRVMMVYEKKHILALTCGVAGAASDKAAVEAVWQTNTGGLCADYFGSLKLPA